MNETAYQDKYEIESRVMLSQEVQFKSRFNFLSTHNGFRRGNIHLFAGPTSAGKSTLTRSLLIDFMQNKKNTLLYLSEETIEAFKTELAFTGLVHDTLKKLFIVSERNIPKGTSDILGFIYKKCQELEIEMLFFDNLTTSSHYELPPNQQALFCNRIKGMAETLNIPVALFMHTNNVSGRTGQILNETHIRGSKSIGNIAEFFYTIQKLELSDGFFYSFIVVHKHRGQSPDSRLFFFRYDKVTRMYQSDKETNYANLKVALKKAVE